MKKAPCKDCASRRVGCHAACAAYRDYKADLHDVYLKKIADDRNDAYFKRKMRLGADKEAKNPSGNRTYRNRRYR